MRQARAYELRPLVTYGSLPGMVVATMPNAKQQRHRRHIETAIDTYLKSLTP